MAPARADMLDELCLLPATEQARALRAGTCSARELVAAHLARIERVEPLVNAIVTRTPERALAAADEADRGRARGEQLPPLHGLPIAHKDLQDTAGVRTTYGSPSYRDHVPVADSLQVGRLREAGAIMLGKTNTPEWGAGSHTFNPVFGATRNPWDPSALRGRLERGRRDRAGLPHGAARRRQRPRRVAAQSRRAGTACWDCARRPASCRAGRSRHRGYRSPSRAQWRARPAISRSCSPRWRATTRATRSRSTRSQTMERPSTAWTDAAWPGARRWAACRSIRPCATPWRARRRCWPRWAWT